MFKFLKIKIYRHKFSVYMVCYLLISILLCTLTCSYFIYNWLGEVQAEASSSYESAERVLKSATNKVDIYMQRVYSNRDLIADASALMGSTAEEYLTKRLENSEYNKSILSFPNDIYEYLGGSSSAISQVTLHTAKTNTVLDFSSGTSMKIKFNVPLSQASELNTIENGFLYRQQLTNPNQVSDNLGELWFLIESDVVFANVSSPVFCGLAAQDANDNIYMVDGDRTQMREILQKEKATGTLNESVINPTHYTIFNSSQFSYKLAFAYDNQVIVGQHTGTLLFIVLLFLAAMLCIILLTVYNLWYDARFLLHIIGIIDQVKVGDFAHSPAPRTRNDEYGMIAGELDDMSQKLERYIHTEYTLKLQQQQAEMKALQQQINPHFLYNTLEVIRSSALVNDDRVTAEAIANLGGLYRLIVKEKDILSIGEEVEILKKFLGIMEVKYPDNFYYQIDIAPQLLNVQTIKLWMQPLAENFFVHGYDRKSEFNLLIISGEEEDDHYVIRLIDNGRGMTPQMMAELNEALNRTQNVELEQENEKEQQKSGNQSIGLRNVYMRLRFFYGDSCTMHVETNEEAGVQVVIMIAKEGASDVSASDC